MVDFKTISEKIIEFGKTNFIEIAYKKAIEIGGGIDRPFVSLTRGYFTQEKEKKFVKALSIPATDDLIPKVLKALTDLNEHIKMDMKDDKVLNPNCSETVWRLNIAKLTADETTQLNKLIEELQQDENWSETEVTFESIFDIPAVSISGDTPYNNSAWLEEQLKTLSFWDKIKLEKQ